MEADFVIAGHFLAVGIESLLRYLFRDSDLYEPSCINFATLDVGRQDINPSVQRVVLLGQENVDAKFARLVLRKLQVHGACMSFFNYLLKTMHHIDSN